MDTQFRILGPIEVGLGDGRLARVPRGRAVSLLALLLVHRGAVLHLDRIVDELWAGAGPRHATNAVHVVASRLRAAVGEDVIVSGGHGYAVRLSPGALDADRFDEQLRRGRDELARDEPWEAAETLRRALALWRGPPLSDVTDEGFAQPEIARLHDLHLTCISERADADLACGRHAEVTAELEALVREHPLRERLRGQLMLALYRGGRQAEALAEYRAARRALVDGLGIEPSPELRALESAILSQDVPGAAPPPERSLVAPATRRRVTCVVALLASTLAERDPEVMQEMVKRYHDTARTVCTRHGGTATELRSDAVVAVFGIPLTHEDDAQRALRAASELVSRLQELPRSPRTRLGVCSGEVVTPAGRPASAPVIAEAVAAAERLARSAADREIRIAESTWRLVRHAARGSALPDGGFLLSELDEDAPAIGRRLDRPLVGRDDEVRQLRDALARVLAQSSPQLLAVLGEPGIGKSRLVAELTPIAAGRATVLTGRCPAYGEGITYWPLREVIEQVTRNHPVGELAAMLRIPPAVAHRVAAAVGLEEGQAGEETRWAFLRLIDALARVRPLIIVIDDAHLAEPALLDLLFDVADRLGDAPVLLVLVARPFDGPAGWARRIEMATTLRLGPLSATASGSLLAAIAEGRLEADEEQRVAATAGGNPLFLEQLVAYVGEGHSTDALPPALHALLAARLDGLDIAARSTLALGAVAGDAFEPAAVHALAGLSRAEVEQACARLVQRDLLIQEAGTEVTLRFRHALIRDAAYASLAKSARARLHDQHASWLEQRAGEVPEADARIGLHLETACRYVEEIDGRAPPDLARRAGRRLAAAARVAHARGDLPGEIGFLQRSVALLGTEEKEGAELLPALVSALFEAGSLDRVEEVADRAVAAGAALGLPGIHARAAVERERIRLACHPETFSVEASVLVTEDATQTLHSLGDELGLARTAYLMSDLAWLRGDLATSYAYAERMLAHARRAGSEFDAATGLALMAWSLVEGPCPVPEAIARCDALAGEVHGQRAAELTLLGCRAVLVAMTGGYDEARSSMARARVGLAELRLGEMSAYLAHLDVIVETLAGDPAAAERAVLDAEAIVSESGDRRFLSTVYVDHAHAILAQGRYADAAKAITRIEAVPAPCDAEWTIKRHAVRALVAVHAGDHRRGLEDARAAVAAADPTGLIVFSADAYRTLAAVLLAAGESHEAARALRRALALDERKGNSAAATATRHRIAALGPIGS